MKTLSYMQGQMRSDKKHPQTNRLGIRPGIAGMSPNPGADIVREARRRDDILSLAQGEGEAATPSFICDGAQEALNQGMTFYGPPLGIGPLRQEISDYYERIYGLDIPYERVYVTGSATTALHIVLTALVDAGDEVVAVTPIWRNLLSAVEMAQANIKEVPLMHGDRSGWSLDLERLFDSCTEKTRVILITTPSNPAGWVMQTEEMRQVMDFARSRNIWVISDEVYSRATYNSVRAPSFLDVSEPEDRLFTVNSFSKTWAMTGWRLGWLTGPRDMAQVVHDIALYDNMGPPPFTQYGAIEALRQGEDFIRAQLALWAGNRDTVVNRFQRHNRLHIDRPQATFYGLFHVDGEPDCRALCRRLIEGVQLALAPGCAFGKVTQGYVRMCFGISPERLNDALDRLESAL